MYIYQHITTTHTMSSAYGFPIFENSTRSERSERRQWALNSTILPATRRALLTRIIPRNSILYHGNRNMYQERLFDGALFFANHEVALDYGREALNRYRCRAFQTVRELEVIDFSDRRNFHVLINEARRQHLDYTVIEDYSGIYKPDLFSRRDYNEKEEIRIDTQHGILAHLMVDIVCRLGFDGWVIPKELPRGGEDEGWNIDAEVLICNVTTNVVDIGDCRHFSRSPQRYFNPSQ